MSTDTDIVETITQQALDKFGAVRKDGYIIVPERQWRRLVSQIFVGGRDKDIIHLDYKESTDGKR